MALLLQLGWQRYLYQLHKKPLRTKALTSAMIASISDIVAQRIISGGYRNWRRTLAMAIYGFLWNGPSAHFWQMFMQPIAWHVETPAEQPATCSVHELCDSGPRGQDALLPT
ncbi:uncharacterized protein HaLaN_10399, partial [Haematococcus lacustris]